MERLFPEAIDAYGVDPVAHHLPGGEDPRDAVERAITCFEEITQLYPGGRVLVVMHTTLIRLALCQLIGVPLARYRSVFPFVYNGAITEIQLDGDMASLVDAHPPTPPATPPSPPHPPSPQTPPP